MRVLVPFLPFSFFFSNSELFFMFLLTMVWIFALKIVNVRPAVNIILVFFSLSSLKENLYVTSVDSNCILAFPCVL